MCKLVILFKRNLLGGIMFGPRTSSVVLNHKIYLKRVKSKTVYAPLRSKSKDWLSWNQDNVKLWTVDSVH